MDRIIIDFGSINRRYISGFEVKLTPLREHTMFELTRTNSGYETFKIQSVITAGSDVLRLKWPKGQEVLLEQFDVLSAKFFDEPDEWEIEVIYQND